MIDFFLDLAQYDFLQRALVVSILTGVISGVLGTFVVLRGLSLLGDAISHAVVPGVAISYLLGISFFYGATLTGLLSALSIGFIQHRTRVRRDAAIGIVLPAAFAIGVILITKATSAIDLTKVLFGNVLAVRKEDMILSLVVGGIVLAVIVVLYKELLVSSFDEPTAEVYGFRTRALHYLVLVMLTLVTVTSMQTVGVILVISLLVTPAATAFLLVKRLPAMMILSAAIGAACAFAGMIVSFALNLPSGPVIALAAALCFVVTMFFSPRQGLLVRLLARSPRSRARSTDAQKETV